MNASTSRPPSGAAGSAAAPDLRKSHGLQALVASLTAGRKAWLLDLGGPVQANIDFCTQDGNRLYIDDLMNAYEYFFSTKEQTEGHFTDSRVREFITTALDFPEASADAILIWDRLQFLPAPVALAVIDRLHKTLAPGKLLLALFRTDQPAAGRPPLRCRVMDAQTLAIGELRQPRLMASYNARSIQKLFQGFSEVKFFVSRESLQEVLVRR